MYITPQIPVYRGASQGLVKAHVADVPFHGVDGFNGVLFSEEGQFGAKLFEINMQKESAALGLISLSHQYKGIDRGTCTGWSVDYPGQYTVDVLQPYVSSILQAL
jgi:hypothetical protein